MSASASLGSKPEFTRRTEADSICMLCYRTVRADRYTSLQQAEREHIALCQPLQGVSPDLRRAS